jgi:haloalkane dehalogenase
MAMPYGEKKTSVVHGRRMAYVEQGDGAPIVFQHGNPYIEQREYLFALWEQVGIDRDVVLVLHDWGSALGFDWANQHRDQVAGIAYMEAFVTPLVWDDYVPARRKVFERLRSAAGEKMVLEDNFFVETHLPGGILRTLSAEEMATYIKPFARPGENRRPTLTLAREVPIDGYPPNVVDIVQDYSNWLAQSEVPKLFVNAEPGALLTGRPREFCRTWPSQTEITVAGKHFVQEDSPDEIGNAIRRFVCDLRKSEHA